MTIRTEDKNLDLKAIVAGYVLYYPGITTAEICRKLRWLGLPDLPTDRTIYRMVERICEENL